jgi:hypothetical protein
MLDKDGFQLFNYVSGTTCTPVMFLIAYGSVESAVQAKSARLPLLHKTARLPQAQKCLAGDRTTPSKTG